ncbi:MAG TPA: sigma factor-like helix-turn-helix DNA-binding protein [Geminicoccaceae bacterium]|nr:sigma factor-like helix-turn-helix DNA-binding protein [Geminicoccaceae bacterium]
MRQETSKSNGDQGFPARAHLGVRGSKYLQPRCPVRSLRTPLSRTAPAQEPCALAEACVIAAVEKICIARSSPCRADRERVIKQAFGEAKTHREIATELALPLGTVKSRLRLALTHLRTSLPMAELR